MAKLVGLLLVLGALVGAAALVPLHGRTVLARWESSRGAADFARRSWQEVAAATGLEDPPRRGGATARPRPAVQPRPVERHTEADRAALERVVSERAADR